MQRFCTFIAKSIAHAIWQSLVSGALIALGFGSELVAKFLVGTEYVQYVRYIDNWIARLGFVILGLLVLAYIFWRQSEADKVEPSRADVGAADAFKNIWSRSKRSKELIRRGALRSVLRYPSLYTSAGVVEEQLRIMLSDELHDRLRQGQITAWGTPRSGGPEQEIDRKEWTEIELGLDEQTLYSIPPIVCAWQRHEDPRTKRLGYVNIRFERRQFYRVFPLSWWPRRIDYVPLRTNS